MSTVAGESNPAVAGPAEPSARRHYRVLDHRHVPPAVREAAEGALRVAGEITGRNPAGYAIEWFEGVYHPAVVRDLGERVLPRDPEGDRVFAMPPGLCGLHRRVAPRVLRVRAALSPRGAAKTAVHEFCHALQLEEHPDVYVLPRAEPILEHEARSLEALLERSEFFQALPDDHEKAVEADRLGKLRGLAGFVRKDVDAGLVSLTRAREVLEAVREAPPELLAKAGVDVTVLLGDEGLAGFLEAAARYKGGEHVEAGTGK